METQKEFKVYEVKTFDDLKQFVECKIVSGDGVKVEGGALLVGVDFINLANDVIFVCLYELQRAGVISHFKQFTPAWLCVPGVDVDKISYWVVAVER